MQYFLRKSLKIGLYAILAVVAFIISLFLGGGKQYGVSEKAPLVPGDIAHADAPPTAGSAGSNGGSAGSTGSEGSAGSSEGGGGGEGSSSG